MHLLWLSVLFACYLGVEKGAAPALGVAPGSRCEMLSVPFQQTADI